MCNLFILNTKLFYITIFPVHMFCILQVLLNKTSIYLTQYAFFLKLLQTLIKASP
jgi:hypothetical protein